MNFEYVLLIVFIILLSLFLYIERKKLAVQKFLFPLLYFVMYKTKWGLNWMEKFSRKHPKSLNLLFNLGVFTGFAGMILISYEVIKITYLAMTSTEKILAITPVLPIEAKGIFYVPFSFWIISIFIIAFVHEFAHGVAARLYSIPVKSSGFAFLGIIIPVLPAAFVEPDEKAVPKKSLLQQLKMFSAGPFSNILFALIFALITIFAFQPLHDSITTSEGIIISSVLKNTPADFSGMNKNEIITFIDGQEAKSIEKFQNLLNNKKPGDEIKIRTDKNEYSVSLAKNPDSEKAFLGIIPKTNFIPKINRTIYKIILWIIELTATLFLLNLGIGLFNLLPLGPLDGGRMLYAVLTNYFSKENSTKIFASISALFLFLILFNLLNSFL